MEMAAGFSRSTTCLTPSVCSRRSALPLLAESQEYGTCLSKAGESETSWRGCCADTACSSIREDWNFDIRREAHGFRGVQLSATLCILSEPRRWACARSRLTNSRQAAISSPTLGDQASMHASAHVLCNGISPTPVMSDQRPGTGRLRRTKSGVIPINPALGMSYIARKPSI